MGFMGFDERLDNIDKSINKLFKMFYRLLATMLVLGKIDATSAEDILSIAKEKDQ